jgi:hypothetical protein
MSMRRFHRWICAAFATVCLCAPADAAGAQGALLKGCVVRDRQVLMLIEEREGANVISGQQRVEAIFAIMHARVVCFEGRVVDALALYDGIGRSVMAEPVPRGRRRWESIDHLHGGMREEQVR